MFHQAKYIISEDGIPVVFSELQKHSDVAAALFGRTPIIGAGFVTISYDGKFQCYGESISLNVKSRGEVDSKKLNKLLGGNVAE